MAKKLTNDDIIATFKNLNERVKVLESATMRTIKRDMNDDFPGMEPMVIGVSEDQLNEVKSMVAELKDKIEFATHKLDNTCRILGLSFYDGQNYLYGKPISDMNYISANADYIRHSFEPMINGKLSVIDKNADMITEQFYVLKTCYEELVKEIKLLKGENFNIELPIGHKNKSIGLERGLYSKY